MANHTHIQIILQSIPQQLCKESRHNVIYLLWRAATISRVKLSSSVTLMSDSHRSVFFSVFCNKNIYRYLVLNFVDMHTLNCVNIFSQIPIIYHNLQCCWSKTVNEFNIQYLILVFILVKFLQNTVSFQFSLNLFLLHQDFIFLSEVIFNSNYGWQICRINTLAAFFFCTMYVQIQIWMSMFDFM